ncbi:hypothetical protein V5093_14935 [Enterobacter cancerogenus]|uniref:hypothetical protein n=1 Tax=Enterobacter cancerogenus TaxID=69218 RepID=UPI0030761019
MEYYEKTPLDHQAVLIDKEYLDAVFIIASMILLMSPVRWPRLISSERTFRRLCIGNFSVEHVEECSSLYLSSAAHAYISTGSTRQKSVRAPGLNTQ